MEVFGDEQAFNKEPLSQNVEEMFIGPFGSSLKNENFVSKENGQTPSKLLIPYTYRMPFRIVQIVEMIDKFH